LGRVIFFTTLVFAFTFSLLVLLVLFICLLTPCHNVPILVLLLCSFVFGSITFVLSMFIGAYPSYVALIPFLFSFSFG
jgi:hypothetical protein